MIELEIVFFLMRREGRENSLRVKLSGWRIYHIAESYQIPRSTFYRAVNNLLKTGTIVRTGRSRYALGNQFRISANGMKKASEVTVE